MSVPNGMYLQKLQNRLLESVAMKDATNVQKVMVITAEDMGKTAAKTVSTAKAEETAVRTVETAKAEETVVKTVETAKAEETAVRTVGTAKAEETVETIAETAVDLKTEAAEIGNPISR